MDVRSRRGRERESSSPDRVKVCMQQQQQQQQPRVKPIIKKVQVVYYLSRNGQLEHPHYMEVTHFANTHLRLKDFIDRLTVLRGKGMPSLYSWSCKRSYKNGYVWNDLVENDIIYPSDGAEFVLKGSELVEGCSEMFQQLHVNSVVNNNNSNRSQVIQEPILHAKRKQLPPSTHQPRHLGETHVINIGSKYDHQYQEFDGDQEEEEEGSESQEEFEDEEIKTSYTSSTTPHSRCSRGVSTDELEEDHNQKSPTTESTRHDPPPQSISSLLSPTTTKTPSCTTTDNNSISRRFEDGDPVGAEPTPGRNSVLLQLISCGNLAVAKTKSSGGNPPSVKGAAEVKMKGNVVKRSDSDLHRGVLYKTALKVTEEDIISCMSENPRFGNLQSEDKEYFSGSIVESMSENRVVDESRLKRSSSYNEERRCKGRAEVEEEALKEEIKVDKAVRGKCIPRKKFSTSSKPTKK